MITIDSQFDSGNITRVEVSKADKIRLQIDTDNQSDFLQWFYFCASGVRGRSYTFCIENAGKTTYPKGWENYSVAMSIDRQRWTRTESTFDGKHLEWTVAFQADRIWFAYFAPYTMERHADLIADASTRAGVYYLNLGRTHLGRSIDYLKISDSQFQDETARRDIAVKSQLWVIGRQHPGESMSEWWMEGWLQRLLDPDDATSVALRKLADIHVVPNMNPDGSWLGNLRTNSLGVNLNREWAEPSVVKSPEVFHVKRLMQLTGIDLALDVHGDEALPYNFIAGTEGIEQWTEERNHQLVSVKRTWAALNPDFQYRHGYPISRRGSANLGICSNQLASLFGCLAMTLEMPFKDTADTPREYQGWCPERSKRLGASFVDVAYLTLTDKLIESV